jgi:hypothetical protein
MLWGWTGYKKLWWAIDDLKLYEGYFKTFSAPQGKVITLRIAFWTDKPTLAMREICKRLSSGEVIMSYSILRYKEIKSKGRERWQK